MAPVLNRAHVGEGRGVKVSARARSRTRLKVADRVRRDARIRADRVDGYGWGTIGARYGISARRAREIWAEGSGFSVDPLLDATAILNETLVKYSRWEGELETLYARTRNPAVQLGAIKTALQLVRDRSSLLHSTGAIDARALRASEYDRDAINTARTILTIFNDHSVPLETQQAVIEALESQIPPSRRQRLKEAFPPLPGG